MISRAQYAASTMNYYPSAARVGRAAAALRRPQCVGRNAADSVPTFTSINKM